MIATAQLEAPNNTFMDAYLHWNIADDYEDISCNYTVKVIPELMTPNVTLFVTSNTSTQLILLYDQEYNISVAASNCAGNSAPAEIFIEWHS